MSSELFNRYRIFNINVTSFLKWVVLVNYKDQEYLTNAISNANLLAPGDVTLG